MKNEWIMNLHSGYVNSPETAKNNPFDFTKWYLRTIPVGTTNDHWKQNVVPPIEAGGNTCNNWNESYFVNISQETNRKDQYLIINNQEQ